MAALDQAVLDFAKSISESDIPAKLRCAACNKLAVNAVRLPCCDQSLCQDCQASTQDACPVCMHSPVDLSTCKPNKALRLTIKAFLKSEEKKRSNKTVSTPVESVVAPTPGAEEQGTPLVDTPPVASPKPTATSALEQQELQVEQNGHVEGEQEESFEAADGQVEGERQENIGQSAMNLGIAETEAGEDAAFEASDAQGDAGMEDANNDDSTNQQSGPMNQSWPMGMAGGMNGFSGQMGMPNMGMQFPPGMFNNFGGMNMGNMGQGMGMGGFGGWNGAQGMMSGPFGFFPNGGGYNQPYGSQMHQFSNQNFANQYRGRGAFRGRGRGGFRGGFRGNGIFFNHQGGMHMANGPMQSQEDQADWDQQPQSDENQRLTGDETQDGGRRTDARYLDEASAAAPETDSVEPTATDQGAALSVGGRGELGRGTDQRSTSENRDTPPAARHVPINAPTGPKAMRMGFANTHSGRLLSQAAESRPSPVPSESANRTAVPETETQVNIPTGPRHANGHSDDRERSRARHSGRGSLNGDDREISKSGRARSRSRTPGDRSRRRRHHEDDRRHEEGKRSGEHSQRNERTEEEASRVRSRRTSKDRRSRSRSPADRDRRHARRERSSRRHRDSSREDRHHRRRSTSRGDHDRDSKRSRREKDDSTQSRRDRDRERDRDRQRREREREPERPRDRERERPKDAPSKPRSRSPAPRRQSDAPPADDIGFRIKGSRVRRESAAGATDPPPTGPKQREPPPPPPPTGPKAMADADPYAVEREKRMQERMQHEQRRREGANSSLGKRERAGDDEGGGGQRRRRGRR